MENSYTLDEAQQVLQKQSNDRMMEEFHREIAATRDRPLLIHCTSMCPGCCEYNGTHGMEGYDLGFSTRGTTECSQTYDLIQLKGHEAYDAILIPASHDIVGKYSYARVHAYYNESFTCCKGANKAVRMAKIYAGYVCTECGAFYVDAMDRSAFRYTATAPFEQPKYPIHLGRPAHYTAPKKKSRRG